MYFPKSDTRLPLSRPIEEAMVNGNTYASVIRVGWIGTNEHGFVMICKVTPAHNLKQVRDIQTHEIIKNIYLKAIADLETVISVLCRVISISPSS